MKRRLLLLLTFIIILCTSACGRPQHTDAIYATDFWGNEVLELPISCSRVPMSKVFSTFTKRISLDALQAEIDTVDLSPYTLTTTLYWEEPESGLASNQKLLIEKTLDGEFLGYYLIVPQGHYYRGNSSNTYFFFGMDAGLGTLHYGTTDSGERYESFDRKCSILFPLHFFESNISVDGGYLNCVLDASYETDYPAADFYAFYERTGRYELEETEGGFQILGYADGYDTSGWPKFPDGPIHFRFNENPGGNYRTENYSVTIDILSEDR
jgi:hypothetical protein